MKGRGGRIVYVGKAKELQKRVSQYFRDGNHPPKVRRMVEAVEDFDTIVTNSEFEALVLECSQIKLHSPKYNILLKDDKGYSYIKITNEEYPRVQAALQKTDDGAEYVGPFTSSFAVREMAETANTAFRLPVCSRRFPADFRKERPCLNLHIKRCMGVCTGKISKDEYDTALSGAVTLIKKGQTQLLAMLKERMMQASDALEFEKAAVLRNQINAIQNMNKGQKVALAENIEQDVIAAVHYHNRAVVVVLRFRGGRLFDKKDFLFIEPDMATIREEFLLQYYNGELPLPARILVDEDFDGKDLIQQLFTERYGKNVNLTVPQKGNGRALINMALLNGGEVLSRDAGRTSKTDRVVDNLAKLLNLPSPPERIEAFDISNWGEGTSVAGMVVFSRGKPLKAAYRRFAMRTVVGIDDYASMGEVISRRIRNFDEKTDDNFATLPSLVFIDGGLGQLNSALAVAKGTAFEGVPFFGMVKDKKHRTRALVGTGGEIALSMQKDVFAFVTAIQDETHRFAISYERIRDKNKRYVSELSAIAGVGEVTQKKLFSTFKTIKRIKKATIEELKSAGINTNVAKNIYDTFNVKQ